MTCCTRQYPPAMATDVRPGDVERFEFGLTALIAGFEVMSRSG